MSRRVAALVALAMLAGPALARVPKFRCLTDGTKPAGKNFFIFHRSKKKLAAAVAMT